MGTFIEPFDFKKILVNYFLGTEELFFFAFIIIYSYAAARYQLSNSLYLIMLVIGTLIFANFIGYTMYILAIFLIGVIAFLILKKFMG